MKKVLFLVIVCFLITTTSLFAQNYIIIGWNDLGMHCANQDFSSFVVLPPFNNVHAQVIQVGDANNPPVVVTSNLRVAYEIPSNTYSVGKTNFWDYAFQIFGVNLPPNIGLTGNGLTGNMVVPLNENDFVATGIPITPYQDSNLVHEDPFQLGLLSLYDQSNNLLATASPVVPVSNEINCVSSGCHASPQALLNQHSEEGGFDPNNTPILCATCHASNALGMPGNPDLPSLSQAIHEHHGEITNDCYKCHPGPNTRCLRDVMSNLHGMVCQDCHGSVSNVGQSIGNGRNPWLQEPSCGATQCHGSQFAEETGKLFRQSRGHGGLFCSACHGEPHAVVPSRVDRDNVMQISLQGHSGTLRECQVCHGVVPSGAGPHGIYGGGNCNYASGDINNNHAVNGVDIVYGVNYLKGTGPVPPVDCGGICPEPSPFYAAGDVNGNCAFNGIDITYFVRFLKGQTPNLLNCSDCPPSGLQLPAPAVKPVNDQMSKTLDKSKFGQIN